MNVARLADLAGMLRVRPGQARPHNLVNTRPDLADMLARGKPAASLPDVLASLYSLCGHAQRLCATLAVDRARGIEVDRDGALELQVGSLRDQVRRVWMDWPGLLSGGRADWRARAQRELLACPLFAAANGARRLGADMLCWLEVEVLGVAPAVWLAHWERDPRAAVRAWCEQHDHWIAEMLVALGPLADRPVPVHDLHAHATPASMHELALALSEQPQFARRPRWAGRCADTGPWNRLHETAAGLIDTVATRLASRLAEIVRLALPDRPGRSGTGWLAQGALTLGRNEGLGWVEMARGLLVHHVVLDGEGSAARVASCRVLAPTEWNFHPDGAVAALLERFPSQPTDADRRDIGVLVAAYDPCVPFEIDGARIKETSHA